MKVIHGPLDRIKLVILCFDGLEPDLVEELNIETLLQVEHGRTDTEGITRQTPTLWASFLTGSRDHAVLGGVVKRSYFKELGYKALSDLDNCLCINVPPIQPWGQYLNGFVYGAFSGEISNEEFLREEYQWYEYEKKATMEAIKTKNTMVISHFIIADHIGHVFREKEDVMSELYEDLGKFTERINNYVDGAVLVISDHGMEPKPPNVQRSGKYGYHARYGFYSISERWNLHNPIHITKFHKVIMNYLGCEKNANV